MTLPSLPPLPPGLTPVRRLGASPVSDVILAVDDQGRQFAVKVLRESVARDPRLRERFRREAELLSAIRHPNLVRCHGDAEVEGRPALLLEYVEGPTLRDVVQEAPLPWEQAARVGIQVARALEKLHAHDALHRDVKPHNVLLNPRRGAVLADLGLVRRREDPELTRQGAALGSPAYMSPEQARDPSAIGAEADVYSLGATLYHALSGRPPFLGSGVGEVIHRVLHEEPDPLPPEVPDPLQRVVATSLAKDPDRRYARARDLAADLGRVLLGYSPRLLTRHRLRVRVRAAVAAGVLAAAGGFGIWLASGEGEPADAPVEAGAAAVAEPGPAARSRRPQPPAREPEVTPPPPGDEAFVAWAAPFEQAYSRYLAQGQLRAAWEEVQALAEAPLPADASERFRLLRERIVHAARGAISAEAERIAARAEQLLDLAYQQALAQVEEGAPLPEDWIGSVERAWEEAGLRAGELPLQPGGADPRSRLALARARLESEVNARLAARARAFIPEKRGRTRELLRQGSFATAEAEWQQVDPALLRHSQAGRRERVRVQELAALERRFLARGDEQAGQAVRWELRGAALEGVVLPRALRESFLLLEVAGRRVKVGLLDLDPEFLPDFLLTEADAEARWLQAQLYWCQGRLDEALAAGRPLAADRWPPEFDPAFWVAEWEKEAAGQAAPAPDGSGAVDGSPEPAAVPDPADSLAAAWRRLLPQEGVVEVEGGAVVLRWEQPTWERPWQVELKLDPRRWRLDEWRVEWSLPAGAQPPQRVVWMDRVQMTRASMRALPVTRVGERVQPGIGIVPGMSQVMEWRSGIVKLDGVAVGELPFREGGHLRLSAAAEPRFTPDRVWVRVAPRSQG